MAQVQVSNKARSGYKGAATTLGLGLTVLWIAGLSSPIATGWLTWLDGVAALYSFAIAGTYSRAETRARQMGRPIGLGIGLFLLSFLGFAQSSPGWLCWWTFTFATAAIILGITAGAIEPSRSIEIDSAAETTYKRSQERFKKTG